MRHVNLDLKNKTMRNRVFNKYNIEVINEGKSIVQRDLSQLKLIRGLRRRIDRLYIGSEKSHKVIIRYFIDCTKFEPDILTTHVDILKVARGR